MKNERSLFDTAPPIGGMRKQFSGLSGLAANTGKLRMVCPICGTDFLRPAAWAKRVNVNYCGRGCAAAGKRIEVECFCSICRSLMILTPSLAAKKTTCGPACSSAKKRSRGLNTKPSSWSAYRDAAAEIGKRGICAKCGTTTGPWMVRGLKVEVIDGCVPSAVSSTASLWCKHCHLVDVAPLGAQERDRRKMPSNVFSTYNHLSVSGYNCP